MPMKNTPRLCWTDILCRALLSAAILTLVPASRFTFADEDIYRAVADFLARYDSDAYRMVEAERLAPISFRDKQGLVTEYSGKGSITDYFDGEGITDILRGLNTAVHETAHSHNTFVGMQRLQASGQFDTVAMSAGLVYLSADDDVLLVHRKVFPSLAFADEVPMDLRDSRYDTYIGAAASSIQSTQSSGVYGLIDEWNAYFLGTRSAVRAAQYYQGKQLRAKNVLNYMGEVDGSLFAYPQFKYFILAWLDYSARNQPRLYQELMQDESFKQAYVGIDTYFAALVEEYRGIRMQLLDQLRAAGESVEFDEMTVSIGNKIHGHFEDYYRRYDSAAKEPRFDRVRRDLANIKRRFTPKKPEPISLGAAPSNDTGNGAELEFLSAFIMGRYDILGLSETGTPYTGWIELMRQSDTEMVLARTIDGRMEHGSASMQRSPESAKPVLRVALPDSGRRGSCLIVSDADNYARLTCYLEYTDKRIDKPIREAWFPYLER